MIADVTRDLMQASLRIAFVAVLGLLLSAPIVGEAQTSQPLQHVQQLMRSPDARFVAVEFYASWCKPCVAAIPKWRALQRKYAKHGLKVVVVSTQDSKGGCEDPGWMPDKVVCDEEGTLAAQFGANKLPSAYLWSWDGRLLAHAAGHSEVASALKRAVRQAPRVAITVDGPISKKSKTTLQALLREQIAESKIRLVASPRQKQRIQKMLKAQHGAKYDEEMHCELGKELPPNALLSAEVRAGALQLALVSAESACVLALGTSSWSAARPRNSVRRASRQLLRRLKRPIALPGTTPTVVRRPPPVPRQSLPEPSSVLVANFRSVPGGAEVFVGEQRICGPTPCSGLVEAGRHTVVFRRTGFADHSQPTIFSSDRLHARAKLNPEAGTNVQDILRKEEEERAAAPPPPPPRPRYSPPPPTPFSPVRPPRGGQSVVVMPIDPQDHRSARERQRLDKVILESLKALGYRASFVPRALAEEARIDDFPKDLRCARGCQALLRKRHPGALLIVPSYRPPRGRKKPVLSLRVTNQSGKSHGTVVWPSEDASKFATDVRTRLYSVIERMGT